MDSYTKFDTSSVVDDSYSIRGYSFRKREIALGAITLVALIVCVTLAAVLASKGSGGGNPSAHPLTNCPGSKQSQTGGNTTTVQPTKATTTVKPTMSTTTAKPNANEMCLTSTCMKSAANVLDNINKAVDPCNNFYQYACGTWAQRNPLKPDVSQLTPAWNIYYKNQEKLRRIMETPVSRNTSWTSEKKLKDYFASCTDHYGRMILQGKPFLEKVVATAGGWYVIGTLNHTYSFEDHLKKTHVDFWTNAFFTFTLKTDQLEWRNFSIQVENGFFPCRGSFTKRS